MAEWTRRKQLGLLLFWVTGAGFAAEPVLRDVNVAGRKAYLVRPPGPAKAAVLFVHWYEPGSADSNRTQFLSQALELAREGVVSLLPETMWSDPEWFRKRDPAKDYEASLETIVELRKAIDYLLEQPGVDGRHFAYVGHDFGMMYGLLLSRYEKRPRAWALQAGTVGFEEWFLLGRMGLPEAEKQKVRDRFAPLAPSRFIGELGVPVLLQFGRRDPYVPQVKAEVLVDRAKVPKQVLYYDAGHGLNDEAVRDRMKWLREVLELN